LGYLFPSGFISPGFISLGFISPGFISPDLFPLDLFLLDLFPQNLIRIHFPSLFEGFYTIVIDNSRGKLGIKGSSPFLTQLENYKKFLASTLNFFEFSN